VDCDISRDQEKSFLEISQGGGTYCPTSRALDAVTKGRGIRKPSLIGGGGKSLIDSRLKIYLTKKAVWVWRGREHSSFIRRGGVVNVGARTAMHHFHPVGRNEIPGLRLSQESVKGGRSWSTGYSLPTTNKGGIIKTIYSKKIKT